MDIQGRAGVPGNQLVTKREEGGCATVPPPCLQWAAAAPRHSGCCLLNGSLGPRNGLEETFTVALKVGA